MEKNKTRCYFGFISECVSFSCPSVVYSLVLWHEINERFSDILLCFQYQTVRKGNQHGGREYDDLQNWLDMTSHELLLVRGILARVQKDAVETLAFCTLKLAVRLVVAVEGLTQPPAKDNKGCVPERYLVKRWLALICAYLKSRLSKPWFKVSSVSGARRLVNHSFLTL